MYSIFYFLLLCLVVLCILHIIFNYNERARLMLKIPGPTGRFIIMNGLDFVLPPVELFKMCRKLAMQYKGFYRFWSFPFGAIIIYNPEDIEIILSNSKHNEKSLLYKFVRPWLGEGLLISGGSKWLQRRKILTPAFHFNILRHFSDVLEENSLRMTETLDNCDGKQTINIVPTLSQYTLNSICETSMGTRLDENKSISGRIYKEAIHKVGKLIVDRMTKIYLFNDFIYNITPAGKIQKKYIEIVHGFTKRVIENRKKFVDKNCIEINEIITDNKDEEVYFYNHKNKIAMLDLLILAEKEGLIDNKGIQEEVDTFMFEGHDTTASGLVYLLMLLANNQDIQDKVVAELKSIFGESTRSATMHDFSNMKYIECCIKESLRLYPPVHFISREIQETTVLSNYTIPPGTHCHIQIFDLHRREDLFKDALKFNPDRFLPENSVGRHPYSYIPFSAGPRNCIGQKFAMLEMKSAVSRLLRKFQLYPVTKPEEITLVADLVLRNIEPVFVTFVRKH